MKRVTRKEFLIGSATVAGACMCGLSGCATITKVGNTPRIEASAYSIVDGPIVQLSLEKSPHLASVGGSGKIIDTELGDSLIIVRTADTEYVANSIKCTHRGVEVEYHHDKTKFKCASLGGSEFALDGSRLSGFAKDPLKTYPISVEQGVLTIDMSG
jgi:Rieske Fe-S protein